MEYIERIYYSLQLSKMNLNHPLWDQALGEYIYSFVDENIFELIHVFFDTNISPEERERYLIELYDIDIYDIEDLKYIRSILEPTMIEELQLINNLIFVLSYMDSQRYLRTSRNYSSAQPVQLGPTSLSALQYLRERGGYIHIEDSYNPPRVFIRPKRVGRVYFEYPKFETGIFESIDKYLESYFPNHDIPTMNY